MARDHAQIRLSIWDDDDFRSLPANAQHLYWMLLTHPELSYCGVADWRPAKLSGWVGDWTAADVQAAADILIDRLYILIDQETEEVLVRSFVRRDGLMKQPKMATAMSTARQAVGSVALRGVVTWEIQRLHREEPDLHGWNSEKATALLAMPSVDPASYPCGKGSGKGSGKGKATPSGKGSSEGSPTPSSLLLAPDSSLLAPKTSSSSARKRATPVPEEFEVTDAMRAWATKKGVTVNLETETETFLDHHRAKGNTFSDWSAAWRTWMTNSVKFQRPLRAVSDNSHDGMVKWAEMSPGYWQQCHAEGVYFGKRTQWLPAGQVPA